MATKEIFIKTATVTCECGDFVVMRSINTHKERNIARGYKCKCGNLFIRKNPEVVRLAYGN